MGAVLDPRYSFALRGRHPALSLLNSCIRALQLLFISLYIGNNTRQGESIGCFTLVETRVLLNGAILNDLYWLVPQNRPIYFEYRLNVQISGMPAVHRTHHGFFCLIFESQYTLISSLYCFIVPFCWAHVSAGLPAFVSCCFFFFFSK